MNLKDNFLPIHKNSQSEKNPSKHSEHDSAFAASIHSAHPSEQLSQVFASVDPLLMHSSQIFSVLLP